MLIQGKVLRLIQDQRFQRLGSNDEISTNVRVIAATNRNLEEMVKKGLFREDLLYRLNGYTIELPPLRDRPEDIEFYSRMFINDLSGGEYFRIEESGLEVLKGHKWDGNVRELSNVIQRIVVFSKRKCLDHKSAIEALNAKDIKAAPMNETKDYGPEQIIDALQRAKWNRTLAASLLEMHKTTLHRYINRYKLRDIIESRDAGRPSAVFAEGI